ncbi:MAG TPA: ShlB/FhaC/HecB family hemolysin secretion/activation protein [Gemmatimonadales bacterium]|jgi:hypothetical protein
MGANFLIPLLTVVAFQSPTQDSTPAYSSPAVRDLIERAMRQRHAGDSAVADYRATVRYRLGVSIGRRRWARVPLSAVEEQIAQVQWQRPNDLRVDVIGRRSRSRSGTIQLSSVFDRPWFLPRGVDDSVRIFSNDFPATGALHPLAKNGPDWYRYALNGGLSVSSAEGAHRLLRVDVTPRRPGLALIAGQMWVDSASAEVVRLTFRYVGTALWVSPKHPTRSDSASARRLNALANRIVSIDADVEYGLEEGQYWMPRRQVIAGRVQIPVVSDVVIPFQATTTFEDYEINSGRSVVFDLPLGDSANAPERPRRDEASDSLRSWDYANRWPGGRYELHRPSNDSLARFTAWPDSLSLNTDPLQARRTREVETELARLAEELPEPLTGQVPFAIAYERMTDAFRYDRVQGVSLGLGSRVRLPGIAFTGLYGTLRYGFSDDRVTGRLTILRDAPGGRFSLSGYREISSVDPLTSNHGIGNTLNALFVAHDNGDYLLAQGVAAGFETSLKVGLDFGVGAQVERQTNVGQEARSAVNDFLGGSGFFPPNPPVDEGTFGGGWVRLSGVSATRWSLTADVLAGGGRSTGRLFGDIRRSIGARRGISLRARAGVATAPTLPQSQFRLGGLGTVRGFDYGTRRGQAFWAAQLDVAPIRGRIRPVVFIDAGQAARAEDLFSSQALVGGGVGISLLSGLIRFDLSHPISPDTGGKVRFDLVVQAAR